MALKNQVPNVYGVGLRNVGSYQVSGTPWVTGSSATHIDNNQIVRYRLPYVAKSFTVINIGTEDLRVHFQSGSSTTVNATDGTVGTGNAASDVMAKFHYITVGKNNGSVTFDVKCKEIYISNHAGGSTSGYQIMAELTQIPTERMYELTGSGINV